jgi:Family of unknown function (DUF6055)
MGRSVNSLPLLFPGPPGTPPTAATPCARARVPQRWGYDVVRLFPDSSATSVTVTFRGVLQASAAHTELRWGIVAKDSSVTKPRYSSIQSGTDGALTFCVNRASRSGWSSSRLRRSSSRSTGTSCTRRSLAIRT